MSNMLADRHPATESNILTNVREAIGVFVELFTAVAVVATVLILLGLTWV